LLGITIPISDIVLWARIAYKYRCWTLFRSSDILRIAYKYRVFLFFIVIACKAL